MAFTGNRDIDFAIMNRMTDEDLVAYCDVNEQTRIYCNDDRYWLQRIRFLYPTLNLTLIHNWKGARTWSWVYNNLFIR